MNDVYVLINSAGFFYDFYDKTWNELIEGCIAPLTINKDVVRYMQKEYPALNIQAYSALQIDLGRNNVIAATIINELPNQGQQGIFYNAITYGDT